MGDGSGIVPQKNGPLNTKETCQELNTKAYAARSGTPLEVA